MTTDQLPQTVGTIIDQNLDMLDELLGREVMSDAVGQLESLRKFRMSVWTQFSKQQRIQLMQRIGVPDAVVDRVYEQVEMAFALIIPPSVSVSAQATVSVVEPAPAEDMFAAIRSRTGAAAKSSWNPVSIIQLAQCLAVCAMELPDMAEVLADMISGSKRGLGLLKDPVLKSNLALWKNIRTTGGPLTLNLDTSGIATRNIQIVDRSSRRKLVAEIFQIIKDKDLDAAIVACAQYFNAGESSRVLTQQGGNSTTDSSRFVGPRDIRRRLDAFLSSATSVMSKGLDAPIITLIGQEINQVILKAYGNRELLNSFGYGVDEDEDPFTVFLNDPDGSRKADAAGILYGNATHDVVRYVAEHYRSDMSENDFISFLADWGPLCDEYCASLAKLAQSSPTPTRVAPGRFVGISDVYASVIAFVNVTIKPDGSIEIQAGASATTPSQEELPIIKWARNPRGRGLNLTGMTRISRLVERYDLLMSEYAIQKAQADSSVDAVSQSRLNRGAEYKMGEIGEVVAELSRIHSEIGGTSLG